MVDAFANEGTVPPAQIDKEVPKANAGVTLGFTVTLNVIMFAHTPGAGVNVYEPEFWLSTLTGLHAPVMPLLEVAGKIGTAVPAHTDSDVPKLNEGVMFGLTVTLKVVLVAH